MIFLGSGFKVLGSEVKTNLDFLVRECQYSFIIEGKKDYKGIAKNSLQFERQPLNSKPRTLEPPIH